MKKSIFIIVLFPCMAFSQIDSSKIKVLQNNLSMLEIKVDEVKRDQLNYSIEKNLLKETYSNNFDKINLVLTAILGIFAVLAFFGIRDINTIKKEYREELEKLRLLQNAVEIKSSEFEASKKKYDEEITEIFKQNEEQNKKIKILEIKDKVSTLFKDKQYGTALEFCAVGLEISPQDIPLQVEKGKILCKLNRLDEAIDAYEKIVSVDPNNRTAIINVTEIYLFQNQSVKANLLIEAHKPFFADKRDLKLLEFLQLFNKYHNDDIKSMKDYAKVIMDMQNPDSQKQITAWDFSDALIFFNNQDDSERKRVILAILFYLNGKMTGRDLNRRLDLKMF